MGTVIQLKRSATPGKIPLVSDIVLGELAVNTYDGSAFLKKDNGSASIIQLVTTDKLKTINNQNINGIGNIVVSLGTKTGEAVVVAFSGNPKKATVTFTTDFADDQYAISLMSSDSRMWTIESKTQSGFVINSNANKAITSPVMYTAIKYGEV